MPAVSPISLIRIKPISGEQERRLRQYGFACQQRPWQSLRVVAHPFVFKCVGVNKRYQRACIRKDNHLPMPSKCLGLVAKSRNPRPRRAQARFNTGSAWS